MSFTVHIYTNILYLIIYVFFKKMENLSTTLLFPFFQLSPESLLAAISWQCWLFLACTPKFFQLLPITQFQSYFPVSGICYNSAVLLIPITFLVSSGCYNTMPQTGWHKQQIFISHISGGWEVQDQGAGNLVLSESPLPGLQMANIMLCPQTVEKMRALNSSSYKQLIPL